MQPVQRNKLLDDLDTNHDSWQQQNDDLVRKIKSGNSESTITLLPSGKLDICIRGEHHATHRVKPSFVQRMMIKKAANNAKVRILDSVLSKLGSQP